jgi:hypothetical protein
MGNRWLGGGFAVGRLSLFPAGAGWSSELAGPVSKMPLMEWCIDGHSVISF